MAGVGGYQAPAKPAAVSGPGRYSQRTDSAPKFRMPDQAYGDGKELATQQAGAPMARTTPKYSAGASGGSTPAAGGGPDILGLDADTTRPDEPVTAGVDAGPGPGSEVLPGNIQAPTGELTNLIYSLSATDRTGQLAALGLAAMRRGL
jgi:hypothetical protein